MNSITATYPGFQALPKGIKQMLLVSESLFFDEAKPPMPGLADARAPHDIVRSWNADARRSAAGRVESAAWEPVDVT